MNQPNSRSARGSHARRHSFASRRTAAQTMAVLATCAAAVVLASACGGSDDDAAAEQAALVEQGRQIFRKRSIDRALATRPDR